MLNHQIKFPFWRITAALMFCSMGCAAIEIGCQLNNLGVVFSFRSFWWVVVVGMAFLSIAGISFAWTNWFSRLAAWFSKWHHKYWVRNCVVKWGMVIILSFGYSYWVLTRGYIVLNGFLARVFIFILVTSLGTLFLRPAAPGQDWKISLASSMLVTAAVFKAMIYILPGISGSPFSLSWSEGSRYYYGSLFFSERLYGLDIPPSPWHASRYLLMSIPFIVPDLPIWVHRLWQVCLWIGLSGWAGLLLAKRLKMAHHLLFISFAAWAFLYLNLGPVYYHLVICVILVYWGLDFDKPVKTMIVLMLASIWAGLSRINWIPLPAMLVITLYMLERPWDWKRQGWKYLLWPVVWSGGMIVASISYFAYINLSGNITSKFGSSYTSDLLWNRLWPNPTFQMGILLGVIIASAPLWLVIYLRFRETVKSRNLLKWIAIAGVMAAFLIGGLIVSVKIGGGSNLHNMDAYFVLLTTVASYLIWGRDVGDREISRVVENKPLRLWLSSLIILTPILLTLREGWVIVMPDPNQDKADLQYLQQIISDTADAGGEVLFIAERQLQVFNLVPSVRFVADYEKIELMEMAMSGNEAYLGRFHDDISNQRFALIISDPIRLDLKDMTDAFSEEHNVWLEEVVLPLVKKYQYEPLGTRRSVHLLTPKQ